MSSSGFPFRGADQEHRAVVGFGPGLPATAGSRMSAVVFAFNELEGLRASLPSLISSGVDEILVMGGGHDGSEEYLRGQASDRVRTIWETERAGKWRAFNRALPLLQGDYVLLVSADVAFDARVPRRLLECMVPGVGVVFPRVVPAAGRGPVAALGATLWEAHDLQITEAQSCELPIHGGEMQLVRRELLEPLQGVVNDDAYLCLRAAQRGYRVVYDRGSIVANTVPETLTELLAQRTRVNYGHHQLAAAGHEPSTLDRFVVRRPLLFARVLARLVSARPAHAIRLPMLMALEFVAVGRGGTDFTRRVDYSRWRQVRSGKQSLEPLTAPQQSL